MSKRDDLFQKFGPLLIEALARATLDQINVLRSKAALPQISYDRAIDEIENHLTHLDQYPWIEHPFTLLKQLSPDTPKTTDSLIQPKSFLSSIYSRLKSLNPFTRR